VLTVDSSALDAGAFTDAQRPNAALFTIPESAPRTLNWNTP
jgi:hypothetical protein